MPVNVNQIPTIQEFEEYLELWRKFFVLDDVMYQKILSDLSLDVDPSKAYSYLIRFLELWGVRRAAVNISPIELSSRILELKAKLASMDKSILEIDLDQMSDEIKEIFEKISNIKNVGPTSASKILHLLRPQLFMMWDMDIAKTYRVKPSPTGYLEFLKRCQLILRSIIREYQDIGIKDPEQYLIKKFGKPLTKLFDEYNWLKTRKWLRRRITELLSI